MHLLLDRSSQSTDLSINDLQEYVLLNYGTFGTQHSLSNISREHLKKDYQFVQDLHINEELAR